MGKPMAISLPLALIVMDIFVFDKHKSIKNTKQAFNIFLKNKLLLFAYSVFIGLMTLYMQQRFMKSLDSVEIHTRVINALSSLLHYLYTIVYPEKLAPFYPYDQWSLSPGWYSLIPVILTVLLIWLSFRLNSYSRLFPLSLVFMLITSLPIIGIISVGHQAAADRYTYIPTLFYYILLSDLLFRISRQFSARHGLTGALITAALFLAYQGLHTTDYTRSWRNDLSLWSRVIEIYPMRSTLAHINLGNSLYVQGNYSAAITEYQKAHTLGKENADLYQRLAMAYFELDQGKSIAYRYFDTALSMADAAEENYTVAIQYYIRNDDLKQAQRALTQALTLYPDSIYLLMLSAKMELNLGNTTAAISSLHRTILLDAGIIDAHLILAEIYLRQKEYADAKIHIDQAAALEPHHKLLKQLQQRLSAQKHSL